MELALLLTALLQLEPNFRLKTIHLFTAQHTLHIQWAACNPYLWRSFSSRRWSHCTSNNSMHAEIGELQALSYYWQCLQQRYPDHGANRARRHPRPGIVGAALLLQRRAATPPAASRIPRTSSTAPCSLTPAGSTSHSAALEGRLVAPLAPRRHQTLAVRSRVFSELPMGILSALLQYTLVS